MHDDVVSDVSCAGLAIAGLAMRGDIPGLERRRRRLRFDPALDAATLMRLIRVVEAA